MADYGTMATFWFWHAVLNHIRYLVIIDNIYLNNSFIWKSICRWRQISPVCVYIHPSSQRTRQTQVENETHRKWKSKQRPSCAIFNRSYNGVKKYFGSIFGLNYEHVCFACKPFNIFLHGGILNEFFKIENALIYKAGST